jgi:hypothetical protein
MGKKRFKKILKSCLKTLKPGERHKLFEYSVFENLPKEYRVSINTVLEANDVRTTFCYAGDLAKNSMDLYWATKINWEQDSIEVYSVDGGPQQTFYLDSVAVIPPEAIPPKWRVKLLHTHKILEIDKAKRKLKKHAKEKNEKMIEELAEENRSLDNEREQNA